MTRVPTVGSLRYLIFKQFRSSETCWQWRCWSINRQTCPLPHCRLRHISNDRRDAIDVVDLITDPINLLRQYNHFTLKISKPPSGVGSNSLEQNLRPMSLELVVLLSTSDTVMPTLEKSNVGSAFSICDRVSGIGQNGFVAE